MFKKFINKIKDKWGRTKADPVKHCKLYNERGCVFVDGAFCDFPKCTMNENFMKPNVLVYSHIDFDRECASMDLTDENVESKEDYAFISIIGTKQVREEYLGEFDTEHYFKENHPNVLNLEFDDVGEDFDFSFKPMALNGEKGKERIIHFKTISEEQAEQCVDFIEKNIGKKFLIHCRAGRSRSQSFFRVISDFYEEYNNCKGNLDNPCVTPNQEVIRKLKRAYYKRNNIYIE